jgi:hypothetical protein
MRAGCYRNISANLFSIIFQVALVFLIVISARVFGQNQGVIEFVRIFTTDNSTIRSSTPAGIGSHAPSGNLYISDSEINAEGNWNCENIFEVPPLGNTLINSYDAYAQGGSPCPDNSHREPTGIVYLNGFFYITDDDEHAIMKHDGDFGAPLLQVQTGGYNDAEGVTADPASGLLYVLIAKVSGVGSSPRVLVFDGDLNYFPGQSFLIPSLTSDPEGIAYHESSGHLFLVSTLSMLVYEIDLSGNVLKEYDISGFSPAPQAPQGLTFAPSSDPNDEPGILHLYIADGAGRVYEANIPGMFDPNPDITVIPDTHDFGDVMIGASTTLDFEIRNDGSENLNVTDISLTGGNFAEFNVDISAVPFTLNAGESQTVPVSFTPISEGAKSTTLRIASNDPNENPLDVALSGNGVIPAPDISVIPVIHQFGFVVINTSLSQSFEIHNDGNQNLFVSDIFLSGGDLLEFNIIISNAPFSLAPGESETVVVSFDPLTLGSKSTMLRIESDDPDENPFDVPLSGTAVETPPPSTTVDFAESQGGGSAGSNTVSTAAGFSGISGDLYLAVISMKPYTPVSGVSGLGLSWTEVRSQCAGREQTGISVWMAQGNSSGGTVTASLDGAPRNAVIVVSRYSGAHPTDPIGNILSGNTNGVNGTCSGGIDNASYAFPFNTSTNNALVFGAAAMRNRTHTPGGYFIERQELHQGSGGDETSMAVMDSTVENLATVSLSGEFGGSVDWAVVGVELIPGAAPDAPNISVTPGNHNYGDVVANTSVSQTFEVKNSGTVELTVNDVSLWGDNAAEFNIDNGGGSFTLAPSETRNVAVSFNPLSIGVKSGTLRFDSNDPNENPFEVPLSGNAVFTPEPDIAVNPASFDYGSVYTGSSASHTFNIHNTGSATLEVSAATLTGTDAGEFAIGGGGPFSIAPGGSQAVEITFNPTTAGAKNAAWRIESDDPDSGTLDVPLSGTGLIPTPDIAINPTTHDFGTVMLLSSASQQSTLSNEGAANLQISAITLEGGNVTEFSIDEGGTAPFTLAPGETHLITVGFSPVTAGSKSTTLRIVSDDPDESPLDVPLSGTAVETPPPGTTVDFVESQGGGSTLSNTVSTAADLSGIPSDLFLAAISMKPYTPVSEVSGLGLSWTEVRGQCAGREQTGISVWMAQGNPGSGTVSATLTDAPLNAVIVVARYTGAHPTNPIGSILSGNTNGVNGTCSGGVDNASYAFPFNTSANNALVFGAAAMRNRTHTPGGYFVERQEYHQGSGGNETSVAVMDSTIENLATVSLNGEFGGSVDWAVVGVEIIPGAAPDAPNISVTPGNHNFGDVVVNTSASQTFAVRNNGTQDLQITAITLTGADVDAFNIISGGDPVMLAPDESHNVEVSFNPASLGAKSTTLRLESNDPDENPLDVTLSGNSIATPEPDIAVDPASHDYGGALINSSVSFSFTVGNEGTADLEVSATDLSGTNASAFSITNGGAFSLAPGETRDIEVDFTPDTPGDYSAVIQISSNDPDENPLEVVLSGTGVETPPPSATVNFEETRSGGAANSDTVSTAGTLSGAPGDLFLAAVSSKPYLEVLHVEGLGLTWSQIDAQCSGRSQTGISVWMAQGIPTDGTVTATFETAASNAAIVVSRYSGASTTNPVSIISGNTNSEDGVCSGGTDNSDYSFPFNTGVTNTLVFGAATMRNKDYLPGGYFIERTDFHQGNGGNESSVAVFDSTVANPSAVNLEGSFSGKTDWAVIGLQIQPQTTTFAKLGGDLPGSMNLMATAVPTEFELAQNYPNPFNPSTTIRYALPYPAMVTLTIYDINGREVSRLIANSAKEAGYHSINWDGRNETGNPAASGFYFYSISVRSLDGSNATFFQTKRMLLVK